jgi:hypothetical protein
MSVIQTGRRGLWLAAPLAAAGVVLMAACSGPAASTASGTQSSTSADASGAAAPGGDMQAFTSCLTENGVTLPNAGKGPRPSGGAHPSGAPHAPGTPPAGASRAAGATPPAPQGVDPAAWNTAMQKCGDLAPANFGRGGGAPGA